MSEPSLLTESPIRDLELDNALETLFAYMERAVPLRTARVDMRRFDGAVPFLPAFTRHWDVEGFLRDVTPRDVDPFDVKMLMSSPGDPKNLNLNRVTTVAPAILREHGVPVRSQHCIRWDMGFLDTRTGAWDSDYGFGQWVGKSGWLFCLGKVANPVPELDEDMTLKITNAHGAAFTFRYEWMARLAFEDRPGVQLPTNPEGARELFKLRDVEEGRKRRTALRHWVRNHTRVCRSGALAEIPEHLRGKQAFSWQGFECELRPSPFDLDRANKAKGDARRKRNKRKKRRNR